MLEATGQKSIIDRMIRAARLDPQLYEEVEHDQSATGQAMLVVVLGAIAGGIGALSGGIAGLVVGVVASLVGWAVYAFIAYWVGTNIFKGPHTEATWGQLLRTLGFANSPRVLMILVVIPVVGIIVGLAVFIWLLFTTVIAIRQALDFDTWRAIATAVVSLLAQVVIYSVVFAIVT
ncbi:MAG: YIP1 family protein [Chloroflexi bacterium]|nr:YIP1 family protein [Chloroflexota bacterium]